MMMFFDCDITGGFKVEDSTSLDCLGFLAGISAPLLSSVRCLLLSADKVSVEVVRTCNGVKKRNP